MLKVLQYARCPFLYGKCQIELLDTGELVRHHNTGNPRCMCRCKTPTRILDGKTSGSIETKPFKRFQIWFGMRFRPGNIIVGNDNLEIIEQSVVAMHSLHFIARASGNKAKPDVSRKRFYSPTNFRKQRNRYLKRLQECLIPSLDHAIGNQGFHPEFTGNLSAVFCISKVLDSPVHTVKLKTGFAKSLSCQLKKKSLTVNKQTVIIPQNSFDHIISLTMFRRIQPKIKHSGIRHKTVTRRQSAAALTFLKDPE